MNNFYGEVIPSYPETDKTLREYFPDYNKIGVMVEIGAYHPIKLSNSYHFEQNGWDTYCIEANPSLAKKFSIRKNKVINYAVADFNKDDVDFDCNTTYCQSFSALKLDESLCKLLGYRPKSIDKIKVNVRTFDHILNNELKHLTKIDILVIDVEGGEMGVLNGFDIKKWKPYLIFIEDHFFNANKKSDINDFLVKNNYRLDKSIVYNCFYLRNV